MVNRYERRPARPLPARTRPDPPTPVRHPAGRRRAAARRAAVRAALRAALRAGRDLAYLFGSLPVALAGFALVAVGLPVGAALTPVLVGIAVLTGLSTVVGVLARGQLRLARALLGPPAAGGGPVATRAARGRRGRLRDRRTWRRFAWFLLAPVATLVPVVVAVLLAAVVGRGLAYPVTEWGVDLHDSWGGPTWTGAVAVHVAGGVAALLLALPLLRLLTGWHAALARGLLR